MGKEMTKTKVQIQGLSNRTHPIAGANGASTSEESCCEAASATPHKITSEEPYSVRFVQHAAAEQVLPVTVVPVEEEGIVTYAVNPGYALRVGGAKRVLFTLVQNEVMIEFCNRQAQYGIRADADDYCRDESKRVKSLTNNPNNKLVEQLSSEEKETNWTCSWRPSTNTCNRCTHYWFNCFLNYYSNYQFSC